jgi:hypothetical protein
MGDDLDDLFQAHVDKFGVEPVITGINFWDPTISWDGIEQAIEDGKPYVEKKPEREADI